MKNAARRERVHARKGRYSRRGIPPAECRRIAPEAPAPIVRRRSLPSAPVPIAPGRSGRPARARKGRAPAPPKPARTPAAEDMSRRDKEKEDRAPPPPRPAPFPKEHEGNTEKDGRPESAPRRIRFTAAPHKSPPAVRKGNGIGC